MTDKIVNNEGGVRKLWIDQLRGIAMLLVIIGHQFPEYTGYFVITSPVKIPLFFAISGYVFNDKHGNIKNFFLGLWKSLIIPWILLSLLPLKLLKAFVIDRSLVVAGQYLLSFISGDVVWYMPCCILAEIIWFFIMKNLKGKNLAVCFVSLVCAVFGYIMSQNGLMYFARLNTAFIAQIFLCLGFVIKEYGSVIKKYTSRILFSSGTIYILMIVLTFLLFPGLNLDVHLNYYYNLFICAAAIFTGCLFLFVVSEKFNKTSRILVFVGQNTLVYYIFYTYCRSVVTLGLGTVIPDNFLGTCLIILLSCVLCAVVSGFLNKYFPAVVGKGRRN